MGAIQPGLDVGESHWVCQCRHCGIQGSEADVASHGPQHGKDCSRHQMSKPVTSDDANLPFPSATADTLPVPSTAVDQSLVPAATVGKHRCTDCNIEGSHLEATTRGSHHDSTCPQHEEKMALAMVPLVNRPSPSWEVWGCQTPVAAPRQRAAVSVGTVQTV